MQQLREALTRLDINPDLSHSSMIQKVLRIALKDGKEEVQPAPAE